MRAAKNRVLIVLNIHDVNEYLNNLYFRNVLFDYQLNNRIYFFRINTRKNIIYLMYEHCIRTIILVINLVIKARSVIKFK